MCHSFQRWMTVLDTVPRYTIQFYNFVFLSSEAVNNLCVFYFY